MLRLRVLLVCLSLLAAGAVLPSARAATQWGGFEVAETRGLDSVGAVVDRRGRVTVLLAGSSSTTGGSLPLYAVRRRADGVWTSPRFLSRTLDDRAGMASSGGGVVTVAYRDKDADGVRTLYASVFRPGAGWSPRRRLGARGVTASGAQVVSSSSGRTIVGWSSSSLDWKRGWVHTRTHVGGEWERRRVHTSSYNSPTLESVVVDEAGHEAVAWTDTEGMHVRRRGVAGGRGWQAARYLGRQGNGVELRLVDGDLTAVWVRPVDTDAWGDPVYSVFTRRQRWSGTWTRVVRLGPAGQDTRAFRVAVDDEGRARVLYFSAATGNPVHERLRRLDGSWGPAHEVVPAHGSRNVLPQLEVDGGGVWHLLSEHSVGDDRLQYRRRVPGRRWSAAHGLDDEAHKLAGGYFLAVARNGRVAVAWNGYSDRTVVRVRPPA